jgi:acetyl esterase/lipase
VQATFPPNEEILDSAYQPPLPDDPRGILRRYRFLPPGAGPNNQYPTVLMFPPDVFWLDYGDHGTMSERVATYDLQYAGFLVFQVNHRLASPSHLTGQHSNGQAPAQTDDAKRQILAALADPQCNGSIYLIGGSAGGCLALWCGLDSASTVTGWNATVRAKIKGVVSFSGVTDPSNWDHPGIDDYTVFETGVDRYVGLPYVPMPTYDYTTLFAASPVSLITTGVTSPPVRLYTSDLDMVSHVQADEMKAALIAINASVTETTFPGSEHAFHNWHVIDPTTGNCVSTDVINFLFSHP